MRVERFPEPTHPGWWRRWESANDLLPQLLLVVLAKEPDNPLAVAAGESKLRVRHRGFGSPVDAYLSAFKDGEWEPAEDMNAAAAGTGGLETVSNRDLYVFICDMPERAVAVFNEAGRRLAGNQDADLCSGEIHRRHTAWDILGLGQDVPSPYARPGEDIDDLLEDAWERMEDSQVGLCWAYSAALQFIHEELRNIPVF